jgi:hypothetical protein
MLVPPEPSWQRLVVQMEAMQQGPLPVLLVLLVLLVLPVLRVLLVLLVLRGSFVLPRGCLLYSWIEQS